MRDNIDLFGAAAALLAAMPVRQLNVQVAPADGNAVEVSLTTQNLDRLDAFVNQRRCVRSSNPSS